MKLPPDLDWGGGRRPRLQSGACGLQLEHALRVLQVTAAWGPEAEFLQRWSAEEKHGWETAGPKIPMAGVGLSSYWILPFFPFPQVCLLSSSFLLCSWYPMSAVELLLG